VKFILTPIYEGEEFSQKPMSTVIRTMRCELCILELPYW